MQRNEYQGLRLFVLGTGPSLASVPFDKLRGELTFGVNGLCAWEELPFGPAFYGLSEPNAWRRWEALASGRFGGSTMIGALPGRPSKRGWYIVDRRQGWQLCDGHFGGKEETFIWVAGGQSVVFELALQAAYWLGFEKVYLLGCDGQGRGHCYEGIAPYAVSTLSTNLASAATCRRAYSEGGRSLVNCTPNSAYEGVLGYTPLEAVLQ